MKMARKNIFIFGAGEMGRMAFEIIEKEFNAIEVDDALEVTLSQSNQNSYVLTTDKNLQDVIRFTINDSVLKIYTTNKITSSKKLEINLKFINLEHITLKNNAKIEGSDG